LNYVFAEHVMRHWDAAYLADARYGSTDLDKVRHGIFLEGRRTAPARVQVLRRGHRRTHLRVEIHEGRKREIRKLFDAVGFPVEALTRVDFAGLTVDGLKPGEWRYLGGAEVRRLKSVVGPAPSPAPPRRKARPRITI
ncbi:MAG: hypothetical protein HGA94_04020, partial [Candidatus Aminicenantes bacterium]|nr:hypothetical protein [Candidatus Aminicenantes bacterium]